MIRRFIGISPLLNEGSWEPLRGSSDGDLGGSRQREGDDDDGKEKEKEEEAG